MILSNEFIRVSKNNYKVMFGASMGLYEDVLYELINHYISVIKPLSVGRWALTAITIDIILFNNIRLRIIR